MSALRGIVAILLVGSIAAAQCGPLGCPVPRPPAQGNETAPPRRSDAIARVLCRGAAGASLGTATLVATTPTASYFLTCGHVFDEPGQPVVVLQGASAPGRLVALDRPHDLALVETRPLPGKPVPTGSLIEGGVLTACGFGSEGSLRCVRGPVTGQSTAAGATYPSVRLRGSVRPGDSGGPVFNPGGRLVAVVWGQRDGETYAMGGAPLARLLSRLPNGGESRPEQQPPALTEPASGEQDAEWRKRIEGRLEALAATPKSDPLPLPSDLVRSEDLQRLQAEWDRRWSERRPQGTPASRGPTLLGTLAEWLWVEPLLATVALGGPLGLGVWSMAGLLRRRALTRPGAETIRPIAVDLPPLPQRVATETHFVPYQRDDFAKAHQWATEQLARKFPGSVELLSSLDSLIRQQLNGRS